MNAIDNVNIPRKKILFVHIAKTAGTSVNHLFSKFFELGEALPNIQLNLLWISDRKIDQIDKISYISGHISYSEFKHKIDLSDFLVVTCLRNPLEHIVSNLLHFRRLYEEKNRKLFEGISDEIKLVILRLAKVDFTSSEAIKYYYKNLNTTEITLFDNVQTRYLTNNFGLGPTGQRIGFKEVTQALKNLKEIDVVGDTSDLQAFITAVSVRMGWPVDEKVIKINERDNEYGIDMNNPAILNALSLFIKYDIALYSQRAQFRCAINTPK